MATTPSPNPQTVAALLDTTWRIAEAEDARTESLDRKATGLATFASVVVSLTATLGTRFLEEFDSVSAFGLYFLGLGLLGASVVMAVRVLLPKEHLTLGISYLRGFPTWSEILKPPEQVRGETMRGLAEAIARERDVNARKAKHVRVALLLLMAGLGAVVLEGLILGSREIS
jgi:hypothetical protein